MVRHHDPCDLAVTLAVEMLKCFRDDSRARRASEQTGSITDIEPALDCTREALMVLTFNFSRPRLRMITKPNAALLLQFLTKMFRNRIGQSECNEVDRAALLPMRQPILGMSNVPIWVEELKGVQVHGRSGGCQPPS